MVWEAVSKAVQNAGKHARSKPWRVTRYRAHWYWGYPVGPVQVFDFRHYWQANAASFVWHHVFGYSCNTWRQNAYHPCQAQQGR
jgi:hypothetical protein